MKKLALGLSALAICAAPAAANAQTWSTTAPAVTVSATVAQMRQFRTDNVVNLTFGTDGVTPGVLKTVAPADNNAAAGVGAKVDVRFNVGTKVTVTGTDLTATINAATYTMTPSYSCAVGTDQTGTGLTAFPTTCAAGYEWLNSTITGMAQRTVLIGASLPAAQSQNAPAGTYTGTLTLVLSASSS